MDERYGGPSSDTSRALPPLAAEALRPDHPRLLELRERYAACDDPVAVTTLWRAPDLRRELDDLLHFRGDNPYVWQFRNVGDAARYKYYFYMREMAQRDPLHLLETLTEDGLFGCWTFEYPGWPMVSRDLLDSINELYFLERHMGLLTRPGVSVLDIGAGYGRLAHRALTAAPGLDAYVCTDAVAESTFLCEYYLRFRGILPRATVLPVDELATALPDRRIDLAINVHSFSEMSHETIDAWLGWLDRLHVPWLFVVPNDADRLRATEADGSRRDFGPLLAAHDYELVVSEPVFADPTFREFMGASDHFLLFGRKDRT